jgi:choline dehydrogenase-like flavoprotein
MPDESFDFIIAGAGSAGCVLANRLSANRCHRVALLEAGPRDTSFWIHLPIGYGTAGPLRVTGIGRRHELVEAFIAAAESCGVPRTADFNGATQEGAGYYQLTTRNGWRVSAADAYLREAKRRNNLEIFTGAHVARVIVENRRATGVVCRIGTQLRELHAKRGVILAAGAVQSPQLLMLSGIGPSEHLRAYGIPVVIDRRRSDATCRTISRCD